jgi:hypothetical protein
MALLDEFMRGNCEYLAFLVWAFGPEVYLSGYLCGKAITPGTWSNI